MKARVDEPGAVGQEVDPRINYPCYKSFDDFIDVERLKSLDGHVAEGIGRHRATQEADFFLNQHPLDAAAPHQPGAREIWLARTLPGVPYDYLDIGKPELWRRTEEADRFPALMAFIETLPFKATSRILLIYDDAATAVPAHRDHLRADVCHEFIWFRTNLRKPFYVLNHETGEKLYVRSHSAWFDTVNQFHGSDPQEGLSFSVRVDGLFADEFRERIPAPPYNNASTPALWACLSG